MSATVEDTLDDLLAPLFDEMSLDSIERITGLRGGKRLQQRVAELARKANEGELSEQERDEYTAIIDAGDILATFQAIARRSLERKSS